MYIKNDDELVANMNTRNIAIVRFTIMSTLHVACF